MKKALVVLIVLVLAGLCGCQGDDGTPPSTPVAESAVAESAVAESTIAPLGLVNFPCGNPSNPNAITLSATLPHLPNFTGIRDHDPNLLQDLQCDFDVFSWNSFIALNHAADGTFGPDQPTVWEGWPESTDIFLEGGADPGEWPGRPHVPSACANAGDLPVFSQLGKRPLLEATEEPFKSGPLVDTNGWNTRFTISVNRDMYDVIHGQQLYSQQGQEVHSAAGHSVAFPCGCNADGTGKKCSSEGQVGAVMVKASWKVLVAGDDRTSFHAVDGLVFTPAHGGQPATCQPRSMGLVGFHIGHKTQTEPQWVWSTFEHVRNVPTMGGPTPGPYNYFIPDCTDCNHVNEPPPPPWSPHGEPVSENSRKSQIMRVIPITDVTRAMNAQAQELLRGTVWANYELISTQWPTNGPGRHPSTPSEPLWCHDLNPTDKSGGPAPIFLGNSTLETYIQGTVPQASSSCIDCHLNATMAVGENNSSDFTYLLELAQ